MDILPSKWVDKPRFQRYAALSTPEFNFFRVSPKQCDVYPPFGVPREGLDVILCSSDNIYFHLFKLFLSTASPFFRDMFTLPQPTKLIDGLDAPDETREGRPVIKVTESSATLERLLALCHHRWISMSAFQRWSDVVDVFEAARKYQMTGVIRHLGSHLTQVDFLEEDLNPLRVFILAHKYEIHSIVEFFARKTLAKPILSRKYIPEMEDVTAGTIQRLNEYHLICGRAARDVVKPDYFPWITRVDFSWFRSSSCKCYTGKKVLLTGRRPTPVARFWIDYMDALADELYETPCIATVKRQDLFDEAVSQAKSCDHCAHSTGYGVADELEVFRGSVAQQVESVLRNIHYPGK